MADQYLDFLTTMSAAGYSGQVREDYAARLTTAPPIHDLTLMPRLTPSQPYEALPSIDSGGLKGTVDCLVCADLVARMINGSRPGLHP
jgi:hypothetical protein